MHALRVDDIIAEEIVIRPRHAAEPAFGVAQRCLRSGKALSPLQLPAEEVVVDAALNANIAVVRHFRRNGERAAVEERKAVTLPALFAAPFRHDGQKGIHLMG